MQLVMVRSQDLLAVCTPQMLLRGSRQPKRRYAHVLEIFSVGAAATHRRAPPASRLLRSRAFRACELCFSLCSKSTGLDTRRFSHHDAPRIACSRNPVRRECSTAHHSPPTPPFPRSAHPRRRVNEPRSLSLSCRPRRSTTRRAMPHSPDGRSSPDAQPPRGAMAQAWSTTTTMSSTAAGTATRASRSSHMSRSRSGSTPPDRRPPTIDRYAES